MSNIEPQGTVYIFGNGILTVPGAAGNWVGKAVTHTHLRGRQYYMGEFHAEKFEYLSSPIRGIAEDRRAAKLVTTIEWYAEHGWNIILVGHSNMANVIINALREVSGLWDYIQEIHLIAPACENDFEINGLNDVEAPVYIYVGGNDTAVKWASTWIGRKLGYGSLGLDGPINQTVPTDVTRIASFRHSTWFEPGRFAAIMKHILNPIPAK